MKNIITSILSLLLLTSSNTLIAEYELDLNIKSYTHNGGKYPPVFFVTDVDDDDFMTKLGDFNAFELLDNESPGYPITVRVLNGLRDDTGGAQGIASAIIMGGTLGLIPGALKKTYIVQYDIFAQGMHVNKFRYEMGYQEFTSLWSYNTNRSGLKPDEQVFLDQTLLNFLTELKNNKESQKIFAEYREYFSE